jgi:hypothetical protein
VHDRLEVAGDAAVVLVFEIPREVQGKKASRMTLTLVQATPRFVDAARPASA